MSIADVVNLYWEQCWNQRRTDRLSEVFHDPYLHGITEVPISRMAAIVDEAVGWMPDFKTEAIDSEILENVIINRMIFTGTHKGKLFGISGTGKPIRCPSLDIFFFRDGKVWRYWHQTDHLPLITGMEAEVRVGDELADWDA